MSNKKKNIELLDSPEVSSWRNLFLTYRAVFSELETKLLQVGCTVPRFQILLHLYLDEQLAPISISKKLKVSRANITTFLKRLIEDELIESTTINGATEKRPHYKLTLKGNKYFEKLLPGHIDNIKAIMKPFNKQTLNVFEEIRNNIEN